MGYTQKTKSYVNRVQKKDLGTTPAGFGVKFCCGSFWTCHLSQGPHKSIVFDEKHTPVLVTISTYTTPTQQKKNKTKKNPKIYKSIVKKKHNTIHVY